MLLPLHLNLQNIGGSASSSKGKGTKPRRVAVEIDGEIFIVSSDYELNLILSKARGLVETQVEREIESAQDKPVAVRIESIGKATPKIKTKSPEIRRVVASYRNEIKQAYRAAIRKAVEEIRVSDDDAVIVLLLSEL